MTLKLIFAILATLSCGLIGYAWAGPLYRRARILERLSISTDALRSSIVDVGRPLADALVSTESKLFVRLAEMLPGKSAAKAWRELQTEERIRGGLLDSLTREDLETLDMLFAGLGSSGREEQRRLLEEVMQKLGRLSVEARVHCGEKGRLYATLGLLCGLALACLFF